MNKNIIRSILESGNYEIVAEKRYKTHAWRFKLTSGTSVYCGDSGKIWASGKSKANVMEYLLPRIPPISNDKVFIVYGRDDEAKKDLISMLKSWGIEGLTIDALPSQGRTIIEQLEHYIPQTNFGIVLATPDDIGYLAGHDSEPKYRARQNVVLELGMLFSKLSRSRVAVVIKKCENFEKPSDIDGVLYLQYEKFISEIKGKLIRELNANGYNV